jgi:hypothetical protein
MPKEIGISDDVGVMQPDKVTKSIDTHESPKNNMQTYLPQNGGEIKAEYMPENDNETTGVRG